MLSHCTEAVVVEVLCMMWALTLVPLFFGWYIFLCCRNEEIVMPAEQVGLVRDNYLWKVNKLNSFILLCMI